MYLTEENEILNGDLVVFSKQREFLKIHKVFQN